MRSELIGLLRCIQSCIISLIINIKYLQSDIHKSSWILLQNLPFLFIILAGGFETGFVSILSTYAVLYVETAYNVATSTAAIACGATVVVSGAFGQFLGGIWVGKTNPTVRRQIIFAIACLCK